MDQFIELGHVTGPQAGDDDIQAKIRSLAEQAGSISVAMTEIIERGRRESASPFRWQRPATTTSVKARQVRAMIAERRLRETVFEEDLFSDPAWDMLLDLYAAQLEQQRVSVSSLQIASVVPSTTALRWLARLERNGLVARLADRFDARRVLVRLTDKGLTLMDRYWSRLWTPGVE
jgi:DNA-binding MarR family transcriptional regulator